MTIMSIDPSGTGETGICLISFDKGIEIKFLRCKSKIWKEHLKRIIELVEEIKPEIVLYEDTTYIYGRQHQGTVGLYKLIGGIVAIQHFCPFIKSIDSVAVNTVKSFKNKLFSGKEEIEDLTVKKGRGHGWKFNKTKINLHQLDALIVYHLWSNKSLESKISIQKRIKVLESKKRLGVNQKRQLQELKSFNP